MEMSGLGMCHPDYYGPALVTEGAGTFTQPPAGSHITPNPYANEIELSGSRGLRGATPFGLAVLGFGLAFAGVLGYSLWKR